MRVAMGILLALLATVFLTSCNDGKAEKAGKTGMQVRKFAVKTEPARVEDVVYRIESVGTLEAEEDVDIPAHVDGVVAKVNFDEGDRVTSSTILAEIDPDRYRLEVERAQAAVEKSKAEVADAQQALEQRESLRKQDPGWVTQEELRKLQTAVDRSRAELSSAEVELSLTRKKLNDSRVRSPFAGLINSKKVSAGEYVKSDTTIATIAKIETLKLRFNIPEVDAARIEIGQDMEFSVRAIAGKVYRAKIFFISTTANPETRMVEVKSHVKNHDLQLRPGYFASISLQTAVHREAVMVPEEAVIPTEEGFVSFVVQDGKAVQKQVEVGQRSQGRVEILKGLAEGEQVVTRGGHSLSDGMPVEVTS